ncbi:interleukin-15 receptor subunit alpha [Rhynochetos jubatus]
MKLCEKSLLTGGAATSDRKHVGNGALPFSIPPAQPQPSQHHLFAGWMRLSQPQGSTNSLYHPARQDFTPPGAVQYRARCSRPKDVANAHIDAGNNTVLNARLRYTCNPGYKRKAGTSSLIHCTYSNGSTKLEWTPATLQCIRDPALPPLTPGPELPTTLRTERTTQRGEEGANASHGAFTPFSPAETSLISSPSPTATPGLSGAASRSPVSPAPDQLSPKTSTLPGMSPSLQTSTPGEGTSPLSPAPMDQATGQAASPGLRFHHFRPDLGPFHCLKPGSGLWEVCATVKGLSVLAVAGIVFYCCWRRRRRRRRKMRMGQDCGVRMAAVSTVAPATENEEMLPPDVFPTG